MEEKELMVNEGTTLVETENIENDVVDLEVSDEAESDTNVAGVAGAIVGGIALIGGGVLAVKKFRKNGGIRNVMITIEAKHQLHQEAVEGRKAAKKKAKEEAAAKHDADVKARKAELKKPAEQKASEEKNSEEKNNKGK